MNEQEIKKENKSLDFEESIRQFHEEGICDWCLGEKKLIEDAGMETERIINCPVCNYKEEDGDSHFENMRNNNI